MRKRTSLSIGRAKKATNKSLTVKKKSVRKRLPLSLL